eukprot:Opistho-1_new@53270
MGRRAVSLIVLFAALLVVRPCGAAPLRHGSGNAQRLKASAMLDTDALRFFAAAQELQDVAAQVLMTTAKLPTVTVEQVMRLYVALNALNSERGPNKELWVRHVESVAGTAVDGTAQAELSARVLLETLDSPPSLFDVQWTETQGVLTGTPTLSPVATLPDANAVAVRLANRRAADAFTANVSMLRDGATFFNGTNGIDELVLLCESATCKLNFFTRMCERGTVEIDPWMLETLRAQRKAMGSVMLPDALFYGTHNSYNDKADMYGFGDWTINMLAEIASKNKWNFVWAQQAFTMTDQLKMGVRMLDLNPVWFAGKLRLCHCGTKFKVVDAVIKVVEQALNRTFNFSSVDLGCSPFDRTFLSGLVEILEFIESPENANDVFLIRINDKGPLVDWGHVADIQAAILMAFGPLLYRVADRPSNTTWHTVDEMVQMGRRIFVFGDRINNDFIHPMHLSPPYPQNSMTYYSPYPSCGSTAPGAFTMYGGESQVVGPIYNGPAEDGLIVRENIKDTVDCGLTVPEMDLVSPALIRAGLWAWADGHAQLFAESNAKVSDDPLCAAIAVTDEPGVESGRWYALNCTTPLHHACRRKAGGWALSTTAGEHMRGGFACESTSAQSVYDHPRTGFENRRLLDLARSTDTDQFVWINFA